MADTVTPSAALHSRLQAFTQQADRIHDDAEALHHTRVASRRLREVVPLVGLKADTAQKLTRRLKKVTRRLGTVRELDVLVLLTQELGQDKRYASTALPRVAAAVEEARDTARRRLAAKLPLAKLRRLADRIDDVAKDQEGDAGRRTSRREHRPAQGWLWAVDARAARRAAGLADAMEAAGALYDASRLHDVRIALKKLRYAMELANEARQRRETPGLLALKSAQDLLGQIQDLEMLATFTRRMQAKQAARNVMASRDFQSLLSALDAECRARHARYMHDRAGLQAIADRTRNAGRQQALAGRRFA